MFAQVCELDIIFNFEKAYFILDEFLMGGEIQDTSKKSVLKAIEQADLLQEVSWPSPPSRRGRKALIHLSLSSWGVNVLHFCGPTTGIKAKATELLGSLGHAKPLYHSKVVAQGGVPLSHWPEPLPSTNMYRKTMLKSHMVERCEHRSNLAAFVRQRTNLLFNSFQEIWPAKPRRACHSKNLRRFAAWCRHAHPKHIQPKMPFSWALVWFTFAGGRITQECVGGDGPCIAQPLWQTVQTQGREGVAR